MKKKYRKFKRLVTIPSILVVMFSSVSSILAEEKSASLVALGRVTRIIDGDTVIADVDGASIRIRLASIDAPELHQPGGERSRQFLANLLADGTICVHSNGRDRYGRTLATLFIGECSINIAMLRAGYAWVYLRKRGARELMRVEEDARNHRRGIWGTAKAVAPWEFRRGGGAKSSSITSSHEEPTQ